MFRQVFDDAARLEDLRPQGKRKRMPVWASGRLHNTGGVVREIARRSVSRSVVAAMSRR